MHKREWGMKLYSFWPLFLYCEIMNMLTKKEAIFGRFLILLFYSGDKNKRRKS